MHQACTSAVFLGITIGLYSYYDTLLKEQQSKQILMGLSGSLMVAMLLFVVGQLDMSSTACMGVGVTLHYFLLASFSWMLVEGR